MDFVAGSEEECFAAEIIPVGFETLAVAMGGDEIVFGVVVWKVTLWFGYDWGPHWHEIPTTCFPDKNEVALHFF